MSKEPRDVVSLLVASELDQRQARLEWEQVTAGRVSCDEVAQRMRDLGHPEEEIARARELFTPFSPEETKVILDRVTALIASERPTKVAPTSSWCNLSKGVPMSSIVLLVLIVLVLAVIPAWPHSQGWGYSPAGLLGTVLVLLLVLKLLHKI